MHRTLRPCPRSRPGHQQRVRPFIFAVALALLATRLPAQVVCGNGDGLTWGPRKEIGVVGGAHFFLRVSIPACAGDQQQVDVVVTNPTTERKHVRFGIRFESRGGVREDGKPAGGPIHENFNGDVAIASWLPFRDKMGVEPDPSLVIRDVTLTNVTVCPAVQPGVPAGAYQNPCPLQSNTLHGTPACPDAGPGDPTYGYTPLMLAARKGDAMLIWQLLVCGADVNAKANDGYTALMFAANTGVVGAAEVLLKAGARVNDRQDHGVTALGIIGDAAPDMSALLRRYGGTL